MRKTATIVFAATIVTFGAVGSAFSADMARRAPVYKAPPPLPAPVAQWTGCYAGLNAGGVWGKLRNTWTPNPAGVPLSGSELAATGSGDIDGDGFTGGGQIGCNWQANQFVYGVEADLQYTGLDGSRDAVGSVYDFTTHSDFNSRWLSTIRGRLGFLVNPTVLIYGTGGLAIANVHTNDFAYFNASDTFNSVSSSTTRTGWTAGAGVEWMFMPKWSLKVEYLYADLGSFNVTSANSDTITFPVSTINHEHRLTENLVRAGINWHF